jgi:DOPA 4,5-dioxygenase
MSTQVDLQDVLQSEIKEWHFHIYFHQKNEKERQAALELQDAVLRLRRDGAFLVVPLRNVYFEPMGPHPVGSIGIWCPSESFVSLFSYVCMNRGELSVLVHPITKEEMKDHVTRSAWIGPPFPLDLSELVEKFEETPLEYPLLKLGYSSETPPISLDARKQLGLNLEKALEGESKAALAPKDPGL